ncbi:MAG: DNA mismatch repair protein MutS [Deltaproteobacteria bacterium]|nr:DNA mismatch repair protein MutS [Deltaproteobacteria bacterium]
MENLTPAMRQYWEIKERYPDSILFFRMGDFYEMFFDDAITAAKVLEITLTKRGKSGGDDIPLCGVPYHAADGYLAKLVRHGFKVAVCEQMEDPKTAKGVVKRDVVRVVTPGTATDSQNLDAKSNSFLMAIHKMDGKFGLAFLDLTTGEFLVTELSDIQSLKDEIGRLEPKEVIVSEGDDEQVAFLRDALEGVVINRLLSDRFDHDRAFRSITEHFKVISLDGFGLSGLKAATSAAGAVLYYIKDTQKVETLPISGIKRYSLDDYLFIDDSARRNLELAANLQNGGKKGSLLGLMDETVTSMGGRKLRSWLNYPLMDVDRINERLDAVTELKERQLVRGRLRETLGGVYDIERLNSRITLGSANAKDMVAMASSLKRIPEIRETLKTERSEERGKLIGDVIEGLDDLPDVVKLIDNAVAENPPFILREGGIIRDGYNQELDDLRSISRDGKGYIARIESREKERTGINSLKVRYNKVFGYYIEVTQANLSAIPADYIRKQTLVNAERFITPELKEYEATVLTAEERIREIEYRLFQEVRERVAAESARIQKTSEGLATVDALASLAEVADRFNYTRPKISDSGPLRIVSGRHPVVESISRSDRFVPNDTFLDRGENQVAIITGPNMAGKSTYIRQVALITIMAQMGSFVPAEEAEIGVVDRVFSRVGASDDLSKGQSTFMVEMTETANILNNGTSKSLIILDEIGRGTSTFDGLSIAWAVAEYISDRVKAKTLFATHYHELTDLALLRGNIRNFNVAVREWNDQVVFLHKIVPGGADRSYGIHVARLAGLPNEVLGRAREILLNLEKGEFSSEGMPKLAQTKGKGKREAQLPLFAPRDTLRDELRALDADSMTPLQALMKLTELKKFI